jgi:hypothetical protein
MDKQVLCSAILAMGLIVGGFLAGGVFAGSSGGSRSSTFVLNRFTGAYDCALEGQGCQHLAKRVD